MEATPIEAVVFDLGGVLLDWNPRHLYRKLFDDHDEMERFLADVCTLEWNSLQDAGRPVSDAIAALASDHPDHAALITAYYDRWDEMVAGDVDGSVEILAEVRATGMPTYLLSNISAEMYPRAESRFEFLRTLDGALTSGEAGTIKPGDEIFHILCRRFDLRPAATVFVDDLPANVETARRLGFHALLFRSPAQLRDDLVSPGVLPGDLPR